MIEKEFIPYELALELKQLGFDEHCLSYYDKEEKLYRSLLEYPIVNSKNGFHHSHNIITAPLYQQAFRFFREKHNLIGGIEYIGGLKPKTTWWDIYVVGHYNIDPKKMEMKYQPYEEAELACLKKLIKIVKTNEIS